MTASDRQTISGLPLFKGLDGAGIDRLLGGSSILRCRKGDVIADEGATAGWLYVLLSGSVEMFTNDGVRDCTLLIFAPSDLFLPAAALLEEPYLASVRVLKPSKLLTLDAGRMRCEMTHNATLACRLMTIVAGQFRVVLRHLKDDRTRHGPQRLAAYLLRLIDESGVDGGVEIPFTKGVLASRLGMTPETMSRALSALTRHGLLVRGHRVSLKDRALVEDFCGPDPLIDGYRDSSGVRAW